MSANNNSEQKSSKPKRIDKYYWLNKGFEMVEGGLERIQGQIKGVNTYINGLLAVYAVSSIIDVIFMEIDTFWKLLIVFLPVIVVKWATYYGHISVLPEVKSFYPDSADSVEITYYQYLDEAQKHVKKLKDFAFGSTIVLLAVLVVVTWWTVGTKTQEKIEKDELKKTKTELQKAQGELKKIKDNELYDLSSKITKDNVLFVGATLPKNKFAGLEILDKNKKSIVAKHKKLVGKHGKLYYQLDLKKLKQTDSIYVHLEYELNEKESMMIIELVTKVKSK